MVVTIIVIGLFGFLISTIHFNFFKYVYVKNSQDILTKVNPNFYSIEDNENIDLKDYSNSLIPAYAFLDPSYFKETVDFGSSDNDILVSAIYWFLTQNKKDVCIEKKYFLKMANLYFGKNKLEWPFNSKDNGYDWLLHAYCFKRNDEINIPKIRLESYNSKELKYWVNLSEEVKETEEIENKFYVVEFSDEKIPKLLRLNVINEEKEIEED